MHILSQVSARAGSLHQPGASIPVDCLQPHTAVAVVHLCAPARAALSASPLVRLLLLGAVCVRTICRALRSFVTAAAAGPAAALSAYECAHYAALSHRRIPQFLHHRS
jgi:hypothetical protein